MAANIWLKNLNCLWKFIHKSDTFNILPERNTQFKNDKRLIFIQNIESNVVYVKHNCWCLKFVANTSLNVSASGWFALGPCPCSVTQIVSQPPHGLTCALSHLLHAPHDYVEGFSKPSWLAQRGEGGGGLRGFYHKVDCSTLQECVQIKQDGHNPL